MRADLHVHSSFSEDGRDDVDTILRTCVEKGLGAISITDHNSLDGSLEAQRKNRYGLIVLLGEEITSKEGHILAYNIREPIPKALSVKRTVALIHEQGGLAVAAHPFRIWSGIGAREARSNAFDAVEAFNGRSLSGANRRALKIAAEKGLAAIGGSDSHSIESLASTCTIFPDGCKDVDDLIRAIRMRETKVEGRNRSLRESFTLGLRNVAGWSRRGFRRL